ncbi:putative OsmC-like protein [Oikeobacillus pervagus]|uniref:OsmC-like protein n=1 Tax=Oikeobacillus pervagus TaxID=1325931 RepID=A0AAJ1SYQ9_9BACI|nr:OsmC family protein [Oikeobacillus pervagus]MDQ0215275.1 putative OsmC-like protein [Oikeobacillus pervagus]
MAKTTFASNVKWSGKSVLSVANMNGKEVLIDEPKHLGGTDQGANPVEYVLSALGGCINVLVVSFAKLHDVEVKGVEVKIEGDLDPDGFLGKNPNVRAGYQEIRYQIYIDSPSSQENIQSLIEHVEKSCPVKDTLQGVPVKGETTITATAEV